MARRSFLEDAPSIDGGKYGAYVPDNRMTLKKKLMLLSVALLTGSGVGYLYASIAAPDLNRRVHDQLSPRKTAEMRKQAIEKSKRRLELAERRKAEEVINTQKKLASTLVTGTGLSTLLGPKPETSSTMAKVEETPEPKSTPKASTKTTPKAKTLQEILDEELAKQKDK